MKKLMIAFGITLLMSQFATAQDESYSFSDVTRLTNLYTEIQSSPSRQVCYPWASTLRLVNIKENQKTMTDILSYENLWIALQETRLIHQRTSTAIDISLDKKGRILEIKSNGTAMDLSKHEKLTNTKFSNHKSSKGKVINIYTSVG